MSEYDAVVVGASVAGSATATLLARQGLDVALVEKSPDPAHYKHLCTHELIARANPVLDRLGVLDELREIGGPHRSPRVWTRYGWIDPKEAPEGGEGMNIRREVMDPLIRRVAATTPGVDLRLGAPVTALTRSPAGRPSGVVVREAGIERELRARVVVGADGQHSAVAKMAGTTARYKDHARFGYAGYFEGVLPARDQEGTARFWMLDPDIAYMFPTDGGLTMLAVAPRATPERLAAFKSDLDGEFRRMYTGLADGPDLSRARLVDKYRGLVATRNSRRRTAAPGLAFVGDAAQVTDFVWGSGCGFALASAEWLADAVGPALAASLPDRQVDRGLQAYRRRHRRELGMHYRLTSDYSTARPFRMGERVLFRGAARDDRVAHAVGVMGARTKTPQRILTPPLLARAAVAALR